MSAIFLHVDTGTSTILRVILVHTLCAGTDPVQYFIAQ